MLRGLLLMLLTRTGLLRLVGKLLLDRRVPFRLKLLLPAAILYLLSPFDLMPDMIAVLGWLDDILAVLVSLALFLGLSPEDMVSQHFRKGKPGSQRRGPAYYHGRPVIEGTYRVLDDSPRRRKG